MKKQFTHRSLEVRGSVHHAGGTPGSTRVTQEEGARGKWQQKPLLWISRKETGEAEHAGLGLGSLNNFTGLWAVLAVPSYVVLRTGYLIWAED